MHIYIERYIDIVLGAKVRSWTLSPTLPFKRLGLRGAWFGAGLYAQVAASFSSTAAQIVAVC